MGKRVAVVLAGCGAGDGSEVREVVLTLLSLERAGAEILCAAPDVPQTIIHDHLTGAVDAAAAPRQVLAEAARLTRGRIRPLAGLGVEEFDALVFPGGQGVGTVLSNYAEKGERCEVLPDVARLLKGALAKHRPIGLIGLAPILAARVLGPVAGVHLTLGPRGTPAAKHAAVMGADVRPGQAGDVFVNRKNRVVSTPAYLYEDIRLTEVAHAIERLVRTLMPLTRGNRPAPSPGQPSLPARGPRPGGAASPAVVSPPAPNRGGPVLRRPAGNSPGGAPPSGNRGPRPEQRPRSPTRGPGSA